ncbi:SAM-dependent methyltransferase [Streptomyces sp. MBT56]|uniref:SAM-dependent methyltransferase n=1 Tax=unclassified Streptomyces TaxID=2593676 RepID=UPI00190DB2AC|nr:MULTISPECIES: SAM-dependent methyltransferase [unclassified Streptomyces]MBK3559100.1 SAM-dependent methyltransferase [Streptomyces sp. MBT56]MBK3600380.1 SAM-dependent methyltransferase [Streptomyces sp. MBT54]MBK3614597.1 SAM-dependent methyltransferase [Streptomyces sp. MBT98]
MFDSSKPSVARMYDHLLGGTDNYQVDRDACVELLRLAPSTRELALVNRAWLVRAVRYLAQERGIRRFLDHGSGLPTRPNVHEVAQAVDPSSEVVYIDNDPVVAAHGRLSLAEDPSTTAILQIDMRQTDLIFNSPEVTKLLRGDQPVAALFVSVLHCIPDTDDPWDLVRRVAQRLPAGSYMVISQLASDDPELRASITAFMDEITGGQWGEVRSTGEVKRFFEGLELLEVDRQEPVEVSTWHRDGDLGPRQREDSEWIEYGGVALIK